MFSTHSLLSIFPSCPGIPQLRSRPHLQNSTLKIKQNNAVCRNVYTHTPIPHARLFCAHSHSPYQILTIVKHSNVVHLCSCLHTEESFIRNAQVGEKLGCGERGGRWVCGGGMCVDKDQCKSQCIVGQERGGGGEGTFLKSLF